VLANGSFFLHRRQLGSTSAGASPLRVGLLARSARRSRVLFRRLAILLLPAAAVTHVNASCDLAVDYVTIATA